jgi:hypothetical protein
VKDIFLLFFQLPEALAHIRQERQNETKWFCLLVLFFPQEWQKHFFFPQ